MLSEIIGYLGIYLSSKYRFLYFIDIFKSFVIIVDIKKSRYHAFIFVFFSELAVQRFIKE